MLKLLTNPYALLAGGLLLIAALAGAYFQGRADGRSIVAAKYLKRDILLRQRMDVMREDIDKVSGAYAAAARDQSTETRVIYNESVKIVERPVYKNICGDKSGAALLDRARINANRAVPIGSPPNLGRATSPPERRD